MIAMKATDRSHRISPLTFLLVVLFSLLTLARTSPPQSDSLTYPVPHLEDGPVGSLRNLTKRAVLADFEAHRARGHRLHCLTSMTRAQAQASNGGISLEANFMLQVSGLEVIEGWEVDPEIDEPDDLDDQYALRPALNDLGVLRRIRNELWYDRLDGRIFPEYDSTRQPQGIPRTKWGGVIIAENVVSVAASMDQNDPGWRDKNRALTRLRHWSDVAWMQWDKACREDGGDRRRVRYIIHSTIENETTLSIIQQAVRRKWPSTPNVGAWDRQNRRVFTDQQDRDLFHAILGTPNGQGVAWLLINHKEALGVKTINRVDIFTDTGTWAIESDTTDGPNREHAIMMLFTVSDA